VRITDRPWVFLFALSALLSTLLLKFLNDVAIILNARYVLMRGPAERERFVRQLTDDTPKHELEFDGDLPGEHKPFVFGGPLSVVRTALTNFDLAVIVFFVAALIDLFVQPLEIQGVACNLVIALTCFYGVVLLLEFLDHLQTYIRADRFQAESRRMRKWCARRRMRRDSAWNRSARM
jgi:hypothetical protein